MAAGAIDKDVLARLDRVESYQAIQQIAARYALSVDSKDVEGVAALFVENVNAGKDWGVGRDAIMRFYRDALSRFYRSMHLIAGHVIEFDDSEHAHGVVHCRAEHEAGTKWGIMVMNYKDDYERHSGRWYSAVVGSSLSTRQISCRVRQGLDSSVVGLKIRTSRVRPGSTLGSPVSTQRLVPIGATLRRPTSLRSRPNPSKHSVRPCALRRKPILKWPVPVISGVRPR